MTQEVGLLVTGSLLTLIGTIVGSIVTYFLDMSRAREESLMQSKKEIYGKIIAAMAGAYVYEEDFNSPTIKQLPSKIKIRVGKLFSQGRLLAGKDLSSKLKELYHCESKKLDNISLNKDNDASLIQERNRLVEEVETLMKKEIGSK